MPMPLQETQQDLARQAQKAGIPRSETEQEMMMGRAKDRAAGIGRSKENDLYHGRRLGKRGATFGGKQ